VPFLLGKIGEKMKIINKKTMELVPYINNPRNNEEAVSGVAASIKEFGFKVPLVITKDNVIVTGHTRLKAAMRLGLEDVPCIMADDLTDSQIKAFRIADNKVGEKSTWDEDLLKVELEQLEDFDFDLELTGFDLDEIGDIISTGEVVEGDFDVEPPKVPKAKLGDMYKLGRHRLICGDSTDQSVVETLMDGVKADLYITDPPYNVEYTGKTKESLTISNDSMGDSDFHQFLVDAFSAADSVMKEGAVFYIWHSDLEGYNFRGACADIGWKVRECLIWNKNSLVIGRQDYQWKHEPCLYGWKDGAAHCWASDRKQTTILEFDRPSRSKEHPTMKPILLFDYRIKNNTKVGDVVLDTFAGSGTTVMACEQNERNAYLVELDPRYVDVIINRWEEYTGEKAELVN